MEKAAEVKTEKRVDSAEVAADRLFLTKAIGNASTATEVIEAIRAHADDRFLTARFDTNPARGYLPGGDLNAYGKASRIGECFLPDVAQDTVARVKARLVELLDHVSALEDACERRSFGTLQHGFGELLLGAVGMSREKSTRASGPVAKVTLLVTGFKAAGMDRAIARSTVIAMIGEGDADKETAAARVFDALWPDAATTAKGATEGAK